LVNEEYDKGVDGKDRKIRIKIEEVKWAFINKMIITDDIIPIDNNLDFY
jgi:hypothetical protein